MEYVDPLVGRIQSVGSTSCRRIDRWPVHDDAGAICAWETGVNNILFCSWQVWDSLFRVRIVSLCHICVRGFLGCLADRTFISKRGSAAWFCPCLLLEW